VASTATNDAFGITEWRLANGARVVLKPTTFKDDEILFRAVSPGGTSLAPDQDFIAAATAPEVVEQGGLGAFRSVDLQKVLAGTTAAVRADIGTTEEGLAGGSSRRDLETMFQLIYLRFTAPRADPVAFGVLKDQLKVALANQQLMPESVFDDAVSAAVTQKPPARAAAHARTNRSDEPRQVARLLQGPVCGRQRLLVRLRRELRRGDDEAARGEVHRQPAVAAPD
jgi:zinc protease